MLTIASILFLTAPIHGPVSSPETTPRLMAPVVASISGQDDEEEKPDKREEIKAALKELKGHIGKRGDEDAQAIAIIETMLLEFPKSGPKDRKDIVKGISECFKKTRKPSSEGVVDNRLHIAAATALGRMGPESVKSLIKWVDHKNFQKEFVGKRAIILALGKTQDEDAVDPIVDLLTHHAFQIQAAAAEALQQFKEIESKERKKIFKEVLDEVARVKNALDVDPTDPLIREQYDTIAGPMLRTLAELSGHETNDPTEYRSWWNDNKKRDWDKEERGKDA